jgi:hypothetical protein
MTKILPTVGRVVWFTPSRSFVPPDFLIIDPARPCSAMVAYVWSDSLVNLTVSDHYGKTFGMTSVPLMQEGEARPEAGYFCEWMPYQVGQAASTPRPNNPGQAAARLGPA